MRSWLQQVGSFGTVLVTHQIIPLFDHEGRAVCVRACACMCVCVCAHNL